MSETFAFEGTGEKWKEFFEHATLNFRIGQVLVEQDKEGLFASVTSEGIAHTWCIVSSSAFKQKGSGEFVMVTSVIKEVLSIMKSSVIYTGIIKGNKIHIQSKDKTENTIVGLGSVPAYKADQSSYVKPHPKVEKRVKFRLDDNEDFPIPFQPKSDQSYEQSVYTDATNLSNMIKDAKKLGSKSFHLATNTESGHLTFVIGNSNGSISRQAHLKLNANSKIIIDWSHKFSSKHFEPVASLLTGDVLLAMTNALTPGKKINPGLWLVTSRSGLVAGYNISVMIEKED